MTKKKKKILRGKAVTLCPFFPIPTHLWTVLIHGRVEAEGTGPAHLGEQDHKGADHPVLEGGGEV